MLQENFLLPRETLTATFTMNRIFRRCYGMIAIFIMIIGFGSCEEENRELRKANRRFDSLSNILEQRKRVSDSLKQLNENGEITKDFPVYFGREFENIKNPEEFVISSLKEHPEMIPIDPVLGGTMEFRHIKVLTDNWVMAHYDDGHIAGESIYSYKLQGDGTLDFELIASRNRE